MDTIAAAVPKTRYPHLDVLRMFAMYLVILLYCLAPYIANTDYYGTRAWWCFQVFNGFSRTCVPLFLMISGFLALNGRPIESLGTYYRKKLLRLLVPFLFWDVVYFLVNCFTDAITPSFGLFLRELVNRGSKYHLWFVYELAAFYLLTPFLKKLVDHCSNRELWVLFLLMILPTAVFPLINTFFPVYIAPLPVLFDGYLGYYFFGYLLGRAELSRNQRCLVYLGALAGLCIIIFGNDHFSSAETINMPFNGGYLLNRYLTAGGLFVLAQQLMKNPGKIRQMLSRLGQRLNRFSYGVYLIHVLVLERCLDPVSQIEIGPVPQLLLATVLVSGITTGLCALMSRIPVVRRLVT